MCAKLLQNQSLEIQLANYGVSTNRIPAPSSPADQQISTRVGGADILMQSSRALLPMYGESMNREFASGPRSVRSS
jgi:hypothetical protein